MLQDRRRGRRETLITFDGASTEGRPMGPLPAGYAGFTWCDNAWFMVRVPGLIHPGQNAALFNAHGRDLFFTRDSAFHFTEMSLSLLWRDTAEIVVEGWNKGEMNYDRAVKVSKTLALRQEVGFSDIDRVVIKPGGGHIAIYSIAVAIDEP